MLDVGAGFVDVREVQAGPQRGTGGERDPPVGFCVGGPVRPQAVQDRSDTGPCAHDYECGG